MDENPAPHCRRRVWPDICSSPSVCLGPAAPSHLEGIKAHHISASTKHEHDPHSRYITTSAISMTNNSVSGIVFFPEYTSASTSTLWIRIKRQIFGISCYRQTIRWPLSGLSPPRQPSTPTTLFQTTAYTACIPCLALGDSTPPSGQRIN